jgi:hypothetical protein
MSRPAQQICWRSVRDPSKLQHHAKQSPATIKISPIQPSTPARRSARASFGSTCEETYLGEPPGANAKRYAEKKEQDDARQIRHEAADAT